MRVKASIILIIAFIALLSCNYNRDSSQDHDNIDFYLGVFSGYQNPKKINKKNVKCIKDNLYQLNDNFYMGIRYYVKTYNAKKDAILPQFKGIYLHKIGNEDIKYINFGSYRFLLQDVLATDDNKIYYFPSNYEVPSVITLKLDPETFQFLDDEYTFVKDKAHIFCLPTNSYVSTNSHKFSTLKVKGVVLGTDGEYFYEYDERIDVKRFMTDYDFLSSKEKDSIIEKYIHH